MSPLLFSIYTEELAARLRHSRLGVRVGQDILGVLLYADDVVLISEDRDELQQMLNISFEYGNEFSLTFN